MENGLVELLKLWWLCFEQVIELINVCKIWWEVIFDLIVFGE